MGIYLNELRFTFQNSNGKFYSVRINVDDGVGSAFLTGGTDAPSGSPHVAPTRVALQVDAGSLSHLKGPTPRTVSYWSHAAVFNTTQSLDDVLDAS